MKTIQLGRIYQHYKGKNYKTITVAKSAENLEELVIYECLYPNPEGQIWARPLKMFLESVDVNGQSVPRFKPLEDN